MAIERSSLNEKDTWDLSALYKEDRDWESDYETLSALSAQEWPSIACHRNTIAESSQNLKTLLNNYFSLSQSLEKLWVFAHLVYDQDLADQKAKERYEKAATLFHSFVNKTAWIDPEILQLDEMRLSDYMAALPEYRFHLERLLRLKPHTLSDKEEQLMALAGRAFETPHSSFTALNNADLKFPPAQGKEVTISQYNMLLRSKERSVREEAYKSLMGRYGEFQNTFSELLSGHVQTHLFNARARKYKSCLEASLFPKDIDTKVYHTLIEAVREKIGVLHDYVKLRKELLGFSDLHLYDLYVPLVDSVNVKYGFDEAVSLIIDSVAPLGESYQATLRAGLTQQRWVDRYENARKRSGAYSSGCYGHHPYILMNYNGLLDDVMTLTHEAGHSMHTFYSHQNQPYHLAHYTIFVAEVASTFHEELLFRHLLGQIRDPQVRCYLINQKIDGIRATLFRQVLFAEFELKIHQFAEEGRPLTPDTLKEIYKGLNADYYGPALTIDSLLPLEFLRIPHFYSDFYVYQYATGISASYALAGRVLNGGAKERDDYLSLLKAGGSGYSLDLLKRAGVDMTHKGAIYALIDYFKDLVALFGEEIKEIKKGAFCSQ